MNTVLLKSLSVLAIYFVGFYYQLSCSSDDVGANRQSDTPVEKDSEITDAPDSEGSSSTDASVNTQQDATVASSDLFTVNYETSDVIGTVGIVTWSIDVNPIDEAYIEFGLDTNYGTEVIVDLNEPGYRTLLLGMKGRSDYHFHIVAKDDATEYVSNDYTITTGPVTNLVQTLEVNVDDEGARARGFIVSSLFQISGGGWQSQNDNKSAGALAFIVDTDGDIVWWYSSNLSNLTRARMSYDGKNMWMISSAQREASGIERVSMDGHDYKLFPIPATHDITPVAGNVMAFPQGGFTDCSVITEITPDGTTTPIFDTSQLSSDIDHLSADECHANAIRYSKTEELYTLSDNILGDVFMIDRTGTLVGRLTDFNFAWGGRQHGHHLLNDGIIIFNNGDDIGQEFSLDWANMKSSEIWRYRSSYKSELLGDVQRLPNGNTIVTYSTAGRIHEIDPSSNRVMEMHISASIGYALWRKTLYGPPPDVAL